jgi:RCC1 and BTB domain-containing protein
MSGYRSRDSGAREPRNVYTFGQNSYGELAHGDTTELLVPTMVEFARNKNVVQIAAGNEHTAILCDNGDMVSRYIVLVALCLYSRRPV